MEKLIYYFLGLNKTNSLSYPMKNDCIRIFEYFNAKGIIHIFQGMENLMRPVCVINLKEKDKNTYLYLSIRKDIKYIIKLFLSNQIIKGE